MKVLDAVAAAIATGDLAAAEQLIHDRGYHRCDEELQTPTRHHRHE